MNMGKAFDTSDRSCETRFDPNPNVWVRNTGNIVGYLAGGELVVGGPSLEFRPGGGVQQSLNQLIEGIDTIQLTKALGSLFSYRITVTGRGSKLFRAPTLLKFKDRTGDVYSLRLFTNRYGTHHVDYWSADPTIVEISFRFPAKDRDLAKVKGMQCLAARGGSPPRSRTASFDFPRHGKLS